MLGACTLEWLSPLTCLMFIQSKMTALHWASFFGQLDAVNELVSLGARLDAQDKVAAVWISVADRAPRSEISCSDTFPVT